MIVYKPPTNGKLPLGRDHLLRCAIVWSDADYAGQEHPNLHTDVAAFYVTIKQSDVATDIAATVSVNSVDNPDQFILDEEATPLEGKMTFWLKRANQVDIIPDTVKYAMDMVIVLTDGKELPYFITNNLVFTKSITGETGYEV